MEDQVDTKTVAVSGINIDKVEGIEVNRLVSFVNHFLITSVNFLNDFCYKCEHKLETINCQISRLDSQLRILESKLSSLPQKTGSIVSSSAPSSTSESSVSQLQTSTTAPTTLSSSTATGNLEAVDETCSTTVEKESDLDASTDEDPKYAKFYKMLAVGVPALAVKHKMTQEGVDPSALDSYLKKKQQQ